ncbi:MAG: ribonuclease HII [Selenomonadaceae bacterium]|nr:ribonuclease HII [Selenomonadaceae bacterium]MBR1858173.1 ribonuclease HII [Selenomonadaceae bacterium]
MTIKELRELRAIERRNKEILRVRELYKYENELQREGYNLIAGVDEAGRGSLAGPMVIAAVILPPDLFIDHLNDSKKLTHNMREKLYDIITSNAISFSSICVNIEDIDKLNVYRATIDGMCRAVKSLPIKPDYVLTDAMKVIFDNGIETKSIIHGDALSASIAAASIIAKVTRDRMTDEWHKVYPQYGFSHNRGYGTKTHIEAIRKFGPSPIHRHTFEPVKSILSNQLTLLY